MGQTEGVGEEIVRSEFDEETWEVSKGFSENTDECKSANGISHAKVILKTCEDTGYIIGLQEVWRDGQRDFTSAG